MRFVLFTLTFFIFHTASAQKAEVDKSGGLVQVDGKDAFYLVKTNKTFGRFDLVLENLEHRQLAYLKAKDVDDLPYDQRGNHVGLYFLVTFTGTSNIANLMNESLSVVKYAAKQIAQAGLVKDGAIDPQAERNFVVSNNGKIFTEPNTVNVVISNPATSSTAVKTPDILVKGKSIYNNGELVGSFKQSSANGITTLSVYNSNDILSATATHPDGDENADWNIISATDNKSFQFLYNPAAGFEKLFRFLAEKAIL